MAEDVSGSLVSVLRYSPGERVDSGYSQTLAFLHRTHVYIYSYQGEHERAPDLNCMYIYIMCLSSAT